MNIYHIDASARSEGSITRELSKTIVEKLSAKDQCKVTYRDLGKAEGLKFVDNEIVGAMFTPEEDRSDTQKNVLQPSDKVVNEALENDVWVIGLPIYNFSTPAVFKTWADMLARARVTFKYTENGPVGLLENKRVFVVIASGGTAIDSEVDFCTPWLRQFLKFIGIDDLTIIKADQFSENKRERIMEDINSAV